MIRSGSSFQGTDGIGCENHMAPYFHVAALPSKNIRKKFADAINSRWIHLPEVLVEGVVDVIDMLHNASLLIDDIEDNSVMRRGAPVAHKLYGLGLTLNCANQVYFEAMEKAMSLPTLAEKILVVSSPGAQEPQATLLAQQHQEIKQYLQQNLPKIQLELMKIFTQEMIELHNGQGRDILWRDTLTCPTMEEYEEMVLQKTGGLFRLALRLLLALHPALNEQVAAATTKTQEPNSTMLLIELVSKIGVFFQKTDDVLNVVSSQYHKNKTFFEDLTEGKFSFPIIHSIREAASRSAAAAATSSAVHTRSASYGGTRSSPVTLANSSFTSIGSNDRGTSSANTTTSHNMASSQPDRRLFHILRQKTEDVELKKFAVELLQDTNTFTFCQEELTKDRAEIGAIVGKLGGCDELLQVLDEFLALADYKPERAVGCNE